MADDGDDDPGLPHQMWCPSCVTTVGDAPTCPNCGLPQLGATPARLRVIAARIHEVQTDHARLLDELNELHAEQAVLLDNLRDPDAGALTRAAGAVRDGINDGVEKARFITPVPAGGRADALGIGRGDWRPERVRDGLLWLGSILLVVSAITFLVVSWERFTPIQRAGVLFAATLVAGGLARWQRTRLRATTEALCALTLGLTLVDWRALERAQVAGDLSSAAWWTLGLGLIGLVTGVAARRTTIITLRIAPVFALPAAGVTGLVALSPTAAEAAIGLALIGTVTIAIHASRRVRDLDDGLTSAMAFVATVTEIATAVLGAIAVIAPLADASTEPVRSLVGPALAVLAIAAAPFTALIMRRAHPPAGGVTGGLTAIVTVSVFGAIATAIGPHLEVHTMVAVLAVLAMAATGAAGRLPETWRAGLVFGAALALGPGIVGAAHDVGAAWFDPLRWLSEPWTGSLGDSARDQLTPMFQLGAERLSSVRHPWPTIVTLLAVSGTMLARDRAAVHAPTLPATSSTVGFVRFVGFVAIAMALAVGVLMVNPTVGVALGVHLLLAVGVAVVAVVTSQGRPGLARELMVGAGAIAVPAVGWAAISEPATVFAVGLVTVGAAVAARFATSGWSRAGTASVIAAGVIAETGLVVHASDGAVPVVGFAMFVAAAITLVVGRHVRGAYTHLAVPMEIVAVLGGLGGLSLAAESPTWRAVSLCVGVTVLVAAGRVRDGRSEGYDVAAMLAAGATTISLIDGVGATVEWFSVPAAIGALAVGLTKRVKVPSWSWSTIGPGLVVGLAPSVALVVQHGGALRPIVVLLAAGATIFVGARTNLRAPIIIGALAVVVIAVDGITPLAAQLPRWLLIGGIGAAALWAGATADRRLVQLRRWRSAIQELA